MKLDRTEKGGYILKRIFAFLFVVTILFTACSGGGNFRVGESMNSINRQYESYIAVSTLSAYKINENYLITIDDGDVVQKMVEFSSDRKCLRVQGLDLIKSGDTSQFLNINFNKLTEEIGQPHTNIGSGFYIPAYITEDAYLVCFELEDETVVEVIRRDLLTKSKIESSRAVNNTESGS